MSDEQSPETGKIKWLLHLCERLGIDQPDLQVGHFPTLAAAEHIKRKLVKKPSPCRHCRRQPVER